MNKHHYDIYKNLSIWKAIDKALDDLANNKDIKETTNRYYIIGYIIDCLYQNNLLKEITKTNDKKG